MQTSEIEHARHKQWATWAAIGLIAVFVISGAATLKFYGMTWDEGLGNLFFGERYLFYLTTFRESFVDFKAELPIHNRPLNLFLSPMREFPHEFPPVTDTLSAASMHLLSYALGWMDAVDAFHFFKIALAGVFLWFLYRFVREEWGTTAGLFSVFFLAFFPRFWGDMYFNPKDIPETIWIGLLVMAYYTWLQRRGAGAAGGGFVRGGAGHQGQRGLRAVDSNSGFLAGEAARGNPERFDPMLAARCLAIRADGCYRTGIVYSKLAVCVCAE